MVAPDPSWDIYDTIRPIIAETYGDNGMSRALMAYLAEYIESYEGADREHGILHVCWNWFPGGTTAENVAHKIEDALNDHRELPARYIDGHWYVPVEDLNEALDALERLYANADWDETLAEAHRVLEISHRLPENY